LESFEYFKIHEESEEAAITKVVPNYTFFPHKFSGNFSHPLAIFPVDNSILAVIFELENQLQCGPPISGFLFRLGPPVGGHWASHAPHTDQNVGASRL
jgi:hypothetical protein